MTKLGAAGCVAAAALLFTLLGERAIRTAAPTFDEPLHLLAGYNYLATGNPRGYFGHPPAARLWAALPMLALRPKLDFPHPDQYHRAEFFLHRNRLSPETMINAARRFNLATIGLLFILAGAAWAWRDGPKAAAAAAVFLALCPSLLAHSSLVTLDAGASLLYFAGAGSLAVAARSRRFGWAAVCGLCCGLAAATKFNFLFLPAALLAGLAAETALGRIPARRAAALGGLVLALGAVVLGIVYRFDWELYFAGLRFMASMFDEGRASFLLGRHSGSSFPHYFPVAFLAKTPVSSLLLGWLGLTLRLRRWREPDTLWRVLPMAAYFAAALASTFQIGHRHILPVYPFWALLAADGALWLWARGGRLRLACVALTAFQAASVFRQSNSPLSYFNEAAGGPDNGYKILVDSNLDWGQALKPLAEELRGRGNPPIYLSYFGSVDPESYGVRYVPVAPMSLIKRNPPPIRPFHSDRILLAVSATNWQGVYYADKTVFNWLKTRRPEKLIGHAIFLYDLTGDREGLLLLADLLRRDRRPIPAAELKAWVNSNGGDTTPIYRKR